MKLLKLKGLREENEETKTVFEKYFLIILSKSRYLPIFQFILLLAIIAEFCLLPVTVCYGIPKVFALTSYAEYAIDILWLF